MKVFYYLRLCLKGCFPLEEYVGREGIIYSRDDPDLLMLFSSREDALQYIEQSQHQYPDRAIQILLHT